jgi:hypothetical protein
MRRHEDDALWIIASLGGRIDSDQEYTAENSERDKIRATQVPSDEQWWHGGIYGDLVDYTTADADSSRNAVKQFASLFPFYQAMVDLFFAREERFQDYLASVRERREEGDLDKVPEVASEPTAASVATESRSDDFEAMIVEPPVRTPVSPEGEPRERSYRAAKYDFLARDAENRAVGERGEEFVVEYERRMLLRRGRDDLAGRVRRISVTEGDGAGYDVSSFDEQGEVKYVEVKTTNLGKATPFYVSLNEVEFSEDHADRYLLYRVFKFATSPQMFVLRGSLRELCRLEAVQFRADF